MDKLAIAQFRPSIPYNQYADICTEWGISMLIAPHSFHRYMPSQPIKQTFVVVSVQPELLHGEGVANFVVNYRSMQHGYKWHITTVGEFRLTNDTNRTLRYAKGS